METLEPSAIHNGIKFFIKLQSNSHQSFCISLPLVSFRFVFQKRLGSLQWDCLVHGCTICKKVWFSQGSQTQSQHWYAHHSRLLCLRNLLHGVGDRKGTRSFVASSLSSGLGRTGTQLVTSQTNQWLRSRASRSQGRLSAASRDADYSKKVFERKTLQGWQWNQRFPFGPMGGRKQRNQIRAGMSL